jgi:hypothetical protein
MVNPVVSIKYMLAGYAVFLTVMAVYPASLVARWRKLKRDLKTLDEIQKRP